jgi:hypothetical protein
VIEYPAILAPCLSQQNINLLQVIQNNALRICLKKPKDTPINSLHSNAKLKTIRERLSEIAAKYLLSTVTYNNPIIIDTIKEFARFSGARVTTKPTLLDPFKEELIQLINANEANIAATQEEELNALIATIHNQQ